mmetsp:Transcript_19680/g.39894  ORF Transcript_19680/g.39894 Transcript_19680/m.39894 type:complete len:137 (-) Transcript_19680:263-673(-)|eukprot:CAMPEP_0183293154 /NCGR_PEP_ID=MMETSP0160_2-20130417/1951_1 /TAXON_ID=2839 ORGANISM="Odontella Sinensis, Strain Grunow 1884" /NCGR_SAMPLE_ID=MMETSP0160_2 /ASSEMBLY_ACC=CAM_ASM_000250 /LENGTH=136 /DNA_ID=CAMNT_0025454223 /DNA_START=91 /DNA_END=501 /DNA_ORIENTATION=+
MANPGTSMAAAVDSEVARFRELQEEVQKLRSDQQTLMGQQNENEMVKQELDLLEDGAFVYKMVGPVLMRNDLDDAKQTVEKRLEYITGELKKLEKKIDDTESRGKESAEKVQKMQAALQQAAADAARQVAQQQAQG